MSYKDRPLQIRVVSSRPIYTDNNSGADMNVAIYEPIFPDDGDWYFLGHLAVPLPGGHHPLDDPLLLKLAPQTIVIRSDDPNALCPVVPDQKLWTDQHSGGSQNIEIYSFKETNRWNYTPMGLFASVVNHYGTDPQQNPSWSKLRAVNNVYLGYAEALKLNSLVKVYQDSGSKAEGHGLWQDMSIWNVRSFSQGLCPQTFMLAQGYNDPPNSVMPRPAWLNSSAVRFVGNAVWMAENTQLHGRKLRDICLPATHDSGTFALTDVMDDDGWKGPLDNLLDVLNEIAQKIRDIPGIGHLLDDLDPLTWILTNGVMPAIHNVSTSTRRSVLQQLWDGIRGFDFRVYYHENDFYVGHGGVIGPKLRDIFQDIAGFLETTEGEIVYMTMGHWTHFDANIHNKFANMVQELLGAYACSRQVVWGSRIPQDVFDRTYQEIVSTGGNAIRSRVILVYDLGPNDSSYGVSNREIFWPITYSPPSSGIGETPPYQLPGIYGFYTATTDKDEMVRKQKEQYQTARANGFPFALYTTLTPSTFDTILRVLMSVKESMFILSILPGSWFVSGIEDILGITAEMLDAALPWHTLEELTQRVSSDFDTLVNDNFRDTAGDNAISLLYLDYFENTKVVDLAIKLSSQNAPVQLAQPIPAASDMSYRLPFDFYRNTVTYQYGRGRVWLCQNPDGTGDVFADDSITLTVVDRNGHVQTYTYDYSHNNSGWIAPQPPTDVTYLFTPGTNTVTIRLTDLYHNSRGCSSFYLVHENV